MKKCNRRNKESKRLIRGRKENEEKE